MQVTVEKDWTTMAGYQAICIRISNTIKAWRCGYVGIPEAHPYWGVGYQDDKLDHLEVHGGLTFSDGRLGWIKIDDPLWWIGFDCDHAGDKSLYGGDGIERSQKYVELQCERLAAQLAKAK